MSCHAWRRNTPRARASHSWALRRDIRRLEYRPAPCGDLRPVLIADGFQSRLSQEVQRIAQFAFLSNLEVQVRTRAHACRAHAADLLAAVNVIALFDADATEVAVPGLVPGGMADDDESAVAA